MKKLIEKAKKANARQAFIIKAKAKEVEDLTLHEAQEIIKWEKEKERNNTIVRLGFTAIGIAASLSLINEIAKEESEFEKYRNEHTA